MIHRLRPIHGSPPPSMPKESFPTPMKTFRLPLLFILATTAARAQEPVPPTPLPPDPGTATTVSVQRTPEELEQLMAPIALYPDALIALILPASTVPTDIVLAARHVRDNPGDRAQIEHRAWDESVKSLTHYPDVLKWMDENLHWTKQVGEAFATQPADVMQAVQRLRSTARAAGTLVDTPQQQVIAEQQVIRIVPAQENVIYVPHYEPEVVFVDRPVYPVYYSRPFLTFGVGVPVGSWLAYDCDWHRNSIWIGNRHRHWTGHDWRRPLVPFASSYHHHSPSVVRRPDVRQWRPPQVPRITVTASNRFRSEVVRPAPLGFANSRFQTFRDSNPSRSHTSRDAVAPAFRGSSAVNRSRSVDAGSSSSRSVDSPPVVPALPRSFSPGFRHENVGPHVATPAVPPLPTARSLQSSRVNPVSSARTVIPQVQAPPPVRRPGDNDGVRDHGNRNRGDSDGIRDHGNRSRSFRSSQPVVSAPLPVAPALPMTSHSRSAQQTGPSVNRSFSRREAAPPVVPALPFHNRSSAPAAVGPVAPQVAPQTAPAPAQQAAPAQRGGGESRGHRGVGRRSS
jgi:hypothetical protein